MPAYLESLFANKGGAKRKCELNDVSSREMLALSVAAMTLECATDVPLRP